ncbi:MAG: FAD:protein FMN transferase [Bacteroidales bacterium]|jgi:thiamine biosynthesis lipoprotein|nr:FAD:protein FMN transferase [Bacteroidales bacterium]
MSKYTNYIALITIALIAFSCSKKDKRYITEDGFAQGSTYHIIYRVPDSCDLSTFKRKVEDSLAVYFNRISRSISGYDSSSLLSRINRGEDIPLDSIFIDNFNASEKMYKISDGYFDPSAAPLFDIWGFGFTDRGSVSSGQIDSIMKFIGMDKLSLYQRDGKTFLKKEYPGIKLNFNAIAQGYTSDYICRRFRLMGLKNFMIDTGGGELYCSGLNSTGGKWRIGIDKPFTNNQIEGKDIQSVLLSSDNGIATSGNYRKYYIKDGKKYSHEINPKTGRPVEHNLLSATVIAKNSTVADAYATYFMVIGLEKSIEILKEEPDMQALLIYGNDNNMNVYKTPGLQLRKPTE